MVVTRPPLQRKIIMLPRKATEEMVVHRGAQRTAVNNTMWVTDNVAAGPSEMYALQGPGVVALHINQSVD